MVRKANRHRPRGTLMPHSSRREPIQPIICRFRHNWVAARLVPAIIGNNWLGGASMKAAVSQELAGLLKEFTASFGVRRLGFAIGVSMLLASQLLFQDSVLDQFSLAETFDSLSLYFFDILTMAVLLAAAVAFVDLRYPEESATRSGSLLISVLTAIPAGGCIQLVVHYGFGPYPAASTILGEASRWIMIGGAITLIHESIRRRRRTLQQLRIAELRRKILENQMVEARIKMMEAQIEPHFLFNTLATVKRLYRTEPANGAKMIARLKEYLQAALPQLRDGVPTLGSEIGLVRSYLEILQMRMGERLEFSIDLPAHLQGNPFPCMVLITLVENAIKHGLNPMPDGGRIDIRVIDDARFIAIEVIDNGAGIQEAAGTSGSGIGLANIRARLDALYGPAASMLLFQNDTAGVTARVQIAKTAVPDITQTGRFAS
jgi:signal transduction histidine kinase